MSAALDLQDLRRVALLRHLSPHVHHGFREAAEGHLSGHHVRDVLGHQLAEGQHAEVVVHRAGELSTESFPAVHCLAKVLDGAASPWLDVHLELGQLRVSRLGAEVALEYSPELQASTLTSVAALVEQAWACPLYEDVEDRARDLDEVHTSLRGAYLDRFGDDVGLALCPEGMAESFGCARFSFAAMRSAQSGNLLKSPSKALMWAKSLDLSWAPPNPE